MLTKEITASQLLGALSSSIKDSKSISIAMINDYLSERGFAILMFLFAFPMAIPLPYPPGFTAVLGTPLMFFSFQMMMGMKKAWLPEWAAKKTINTSHLIFVINKIEKIFQFLEKKLKIRLLYFSSCSGERIIGAISLLCAISIALPIMFGNAVPSAGICVMSLGLLSKDGVVIILGMITSIIGLFVSAMVVYLIFWGAKLATGSLFEQLLH